LNLACADLGCVRKSGTISASGKQNDSKASHESGAEKRHHRGNDTNKALTIGVCLM
jgi:hypothetical protein